MVSRFSHADCHRLPRLCISSYFIQICLLKVTLRQAIFHQTVVTRHKNFEEKSNSFKSFSKLESSFLIILKWNQDFLAALLKVLSGSILFESSNFCLPLNQLFVIYAWPLNYLTICNYYLSLMLYFRKKVCYLIWKWSKEVIFGFG